jgi:hypothetical protein
VLNPPETYLTYRTDMLPRGSRLGRVADVYARELRRARLQVARFGLRLPGRRIEVDGENGPVLITVAIGNDSAELMARCQRNGPTRPNELEPPCKRGLP